MSDFELLTAEDVQLMQGMAQRVFAAGPEMLNAEATFGELAWNWGHRRHVQRKHWARKLWRTDGGELVAWGWAQFPHELPPRDDGSASAPITSATLVFQVDPEFAEVITDVIEWFDEVAPDVERSVVAVSADEYGQRAWAAYGYELDPGDGLQYNHRELTDLATPALPDGFRFTSAAEVSPEAVVAAHAGAWPSTRFNLAAYEGVLATATYRPDLHVLVEAPDGTMAASATMWWDEANQTVEFEPLGTHRDFRRQGISTALLLHGMRLIRAAGGTTATVACETRSGNAALELYRSLGFREISRDRMYVKRAS